MYDASKNYHYAEPVREPLSLEPNFTYPWSTLLNSFYWETEYIRLHLTIFVLVEEISEMDNVSPQ